MVMNSTKDNENWRREQQVYRLMGIAGKKRVANSADLL